MVWMITLEAKYCRAILDGTKKLEVRTRIPRECEVGDAVLVCMKGSNGVVSFYFVIDYIFERSPDFLWSLAHEQMAIDEKDYLQYTKGKNKVYGLRIRCVCKYVCEKHISFFGVKKAPQWFTAVQSARRKTTLITTVEPRDHKHDALVSIYSSYGRVLTAV